MCFDTSYYYCTRKDSHGPVTDDLTPYPWKIKDTFLDGKSKEQESFQLVDFLYLYRNTYLYTFHQFSKHFVLTHVRCKRQRYKSFSRARSYILFVRAISKSGRIVAGLIPNPSVWTSYCVIVGDKQSIRF